MSDTVLNTPITRRRFLQATGAAGTAGAVGFGTGVLPGFSTLSEAHADVAPQASAETVVTKSFCNQCSASCGIDVYTTDGRVHAIYGQLDNPITQGKLCPKGYYGVYFLYDPDRFKGPMKRTNPKKGRDEDPRFVPISWDEALGTVAARLNALRAKGESHRFGLLAGRAWGPVNSSLFKSLGTLYGTPNIGIDHGSISADAVKKARLFTDGNYGYNTLDCANTNYMLIAGTSFLETGRPLNAFLQAWGTMRSKAPRTKVTTVNVHLSTSSAASDRQLMIKPGTDGAFALALAHIILTESLWERKFVGDFVPVIQPEDPAEPRIPAHRFEAGKEIDPASFSEKWTLGLAEWWNKVVKDTTPQWAAEITSIPVEEIYAVGRELGTVRPAMVLMERGVVAHYNGVYNGMAFNALNALVGAFFAKGGIGYNQGPPWGKLTTKAEDYLDDYAKAPERKKPRVDKAKTPAWPLAGSRIQDIPANHLAGDPYKLDTVMFYLTSPVFSAPNSREWEQAMADDMFVIDTSPFPSETSVFADLILPEPTYLERHQLNGGPPFQGYPLAVIRTPAVKPLYDTMVFSDILIEIGKRLGGPTGAYFAKLGNTENMMRELAAGFAEKPGTNGVNGYDSLVEKGVWYKKPYSFRQSGGEFFEWDGAAKSYSKPMSAALVKEKLFKTPSGKYEFKSGYITDEHYAHYAQERFGIELDRVGFPQYIPARYYGGGDLHFVTPKLATQAEGRSGNLPHVSALMQPSVGGNREVYLEIHPDTARQRGIRDGDRVRIRNEVGSIEAIARHFTGTRPDTVVLPMVHGHWGMGRWSKGGSITGSVNEVIANVSEPFSGLACANSTKVFVEKV